jgi:hypothetical protein
VKVFDGFTFNDELELLELRLEELEDVVDYHILVELPVTFRCEPKPLHYLNNRERFTRWNHKIIHIAPEVHPVGPHPTTEWYQRRQIFKGVADAHPSDLVIMGDVDEIPNREVISTFKVKPKTHPVSLWQHLYFHKVNMLSTLPWIGTVIMPRGTRDIDFEHVRDNRANFPLIEYGGWHLTWLGDTDRIMKKLSDMDCDREQRIYPAVTPLVIPQEREVVELAVSTDADMFGRSTDVYQRNKVEIEPGVMHPYCIENWIAAYPEFVL